VRELLVIDFGAQDFISHTLIHVSVVIRVLDADERQPRFPKPAQSGRAARYCRLALSCHLAQGIGVYLSIEPAQLKAIVAIRPRSTTGTYDD
jgi:hypothetical protein